MRDRAQVPEQDRSWFNEPKNINKLVYGLYVTCALLVLVDFFYDNHPYFSFEGWIGFFGFYAFLGCVALVMIAKAMRRFLRRPENYYGKAGEDVDAGGDESSEAGDD